MSKVLVYLLFAFVFGAVVTARDQGRRPGYCKYGGLYIKEGDTVSAPIGECSSLACRKTAKGEDIAILPCGLFYIPRGCRLLEPDLRKPYPDCCAKTVCSKS